MAFYDLIAEDFELRVILPEGAYDIKHNMPYDVDSQTTEITHSYMDITGRPTIVFKKWLISSTDHTQDFSIEYKFEKTGMLREPLMLFGVFFCLFMGLIFLRRLNLKSFS